MAYLIIIGLFRALLSTLQALWVATRLRTIENVHGYKVCAMFGLLEQLTKIMMLFITTWAVVELCKHNLLKLAKYCCCRFKCCETSCCKNIDCNACKWVPELLYFGVTAGISIVTAKVPLFLKDYDVTRPLEKCWIIDTVECENHVVGIVQQVFFWYVWVVLFIIATPVAFVIELCHKYIPYETYEVRDAETARNGSTKGSKFGAGVTIILFIHVVIYWLFQSFDFVVTMIRLANGNTVPVALWYFAAVFETVTTATVPFLLLCYINCCR